MNIWNYFIFEYIGLIRYYVISITEDGELKEYRWPYSRIDKTEFLAKIALVEKFLQKYGAEYIGEFREDNTWLLNDGFHVYEKIQQHIWKKENEYIRVDRVYFSEKPFLVLEYSKDREGPYEDSDPFPYDLSDDAIEREIRYFLGVESS